MFTKHHWYMLAGFLLAIVLIVGAAFLLFAQVLDQ
jgi:HAMP domain-containing protein